MRIIRQIAKILFRILFLLPTKYIIFESYPDQSDNTKAVYDEMLKRQINHRYTFIWALSKKKKKYRNKLKRVKYIDRNSLRMKYYLYRSKMVICCNKYLYSENPRALNMYLSHGNPLKNSKGYFKDASNYDYFLASSEKMKEIRNRIYGISCTKLVALGFPRNDILTCASLNLHNYFPYEYQKVIVWYPTYRQHSNGKQTNSIHALPVIWDELKAKEINKFAHDSKVLIVIKPHFAQDISYIRKLDLYNLIFIDDSFFTENNISSYQFVGSCDALLTDYSSIYYDYTLCDKPIGLTWEDYKEYEQNPGFVVDMNTIMKGGFKIYDLDDLKRFIKDVADGIDILQSERREIRDFANYSTDGKNAKRVVDFIVEKARL